MTSENEEEEDLNGLQSQLVQLSRTRRLCRLLVDCDSTGSGVKLDGEGEPGAIGHECLLEGDGRCRGSSPGLSAPHPHMLLLPNSSMCTTG